MKKIFFTVMLIAVLVAPAIAREPSYNDLYRLLNQLLGSVETFMADIEDAENADQIVDAIEKFAKTYSKIEKKAEKMEEKYPDLDFDNLPDKFDDLLTRMEAVGS